MTKKATVKEIEPLIDKYKGNIAAIARHFGVSRGTIYNRLKESSTLASAMDDAKESMIDNAESMLYKQIGEGNITAIIFFLKTQGKGRGYVERTEHRHLEWHDEVIEALRKGELEPEIAKALYGEQLATEFFRKAGVDAG